jgi:hypothetical protein
MVTWLHVGELILILLLWVVRAVTSTPIPGFFIWLGILALLITLSTSL